jgi:FHS family L-fucose permease-like MFS transporter
MNAAQKKAFSALILVFFFWGFVAAGNDILIPVFKNALDLTQLQSQMVSFAFYVAYTIGSIGYIFISKYRQKDIIQSIGYRKGLALGLVISALGTGLFFPAAQYYSNAKEKHDEKLTDYYYRMSMMYKGQLTLDYAEANDNTKLIAEAEFSEAKMTTFIIFITGLFIVGIGFSLQQTVANPLAIILGNPSEGSQRLSLAGGINNIGTTIGPLIVAFAIFGKVGEHSAINVAAVKIPYLILGLSFLAAAYFFLKSSIPDHIETAEKSVDASHEDSNKKSVFRYPQLYLGMIAIFVYVGVEVSTASNLPEFMKQKMKVNEDAIAPFVSLFWASLMIGRWTSAGLVFAKNETQKMLFRIALPYSAFGVFLLVNWIAGHSLTPFYPYAAIIPVLILGDILSKGNPSQQLLIYSGLGIVALLIGIFGSEMISVYAFISVGLFCSTLWPCIYTLAIAGLGEKTNEGSGYLIMMIMGGGFISVLQGALSDNALLGIQSSYWVGVACFGYLAFYAWKVSQELKKQGVNFDAVQAGGH